MANAAPSIEGIRQALAERGLHLRGGWRPDPEADRLPMLPGGGSAGVVWMVRYGVPKLLRSSEREQLLGGLSKRWKSFRGQG